MNETIEQQMKDSDIIFTAISTGDFDDFKQAQQAVVMLYVTDMSYSRSGISHALKRLEKHYTTMNDDDPFTDEEQRFNNMLDGIEEEYAEILREQEEEQDKKANRNAIIMAVMIVTAIAIVVWAATGFYEPWR